MTRANARVRNAVRSCSRSGAGSVDVFRAAMKELGGGVPIDGWCGLTFDPATLIMTGGVHEHGLTPAAIRRLLEIEHGETDANLFADLARGKSATCVLSEAAGPGESVRYRDVLRPSGYGEELRVMLRAGGSCWGAIVMFRKSGGPPFGADEIAIVNDVAEPIAEAIRFSLMASSTSNAGGLSDRALVVIGKDGTIESATPPAERIMARLVEAGPPDPHGVPFTVQAVAQQARRIAQSAEGEQLTAETRVRTSDGDWLTLRASAVGGGDSERVVVFIQPSGPMEVASLILRAYGLTRREGELVRLVLHGFDTAQIAESLEISPYTVQDHLKSIFDKVGVGSRKELVARLFFTHYLPRMQKGVPPGPDGWFVE